MHSFGVFVHNDTVLSLGRAEDMLSDRSIQCKPVFATFMQSLGMSSVDVYVVAGKLSRVQQELGTSDFMIHHIHAFTIHCTVLICAKGTLFSRSSRLVSDKDTLGYIYPCDGPGRGGTCQISPWDHIYLALFWMYNSLSIVLFHFAWKVQSDCWGKAVNGKLNTLIGSTFDFSANTLIGWLGGFLWSSTCSVLQSYASYQAPYGLLFLVAHFIWALSLMFLFSGRGYWQELIEAILWSHSKLAVAPFVLPRALSIVHGRAVGVAKYLLGGIATTWAFLCSALS
jgi:photosystem I P700 chlorophyll a apoprotein A1